MNKVTNESITLYEIWGIFNEANKDSEYLLSIDDEEKIYKILKGYGESINVEDESYNITPIIVVILTLILNIFINF